MSCLTTLSPQLIPIIFNIIVPVVGVDHPLAGIHLLGERADADTWSIPSCEQPCGIGVSQAGERVAVFWISVDKATIRQQVAERLLKIPYCGAIR